MAQAPPQAETSTLQTDDWEEEDFLATLARLERLQNQLDKVRMMPQTLIQTLQEPRATPRDFAQAFIAAVRGSGRALDGLKRACEEPHTELLLRRCARTLDKHVPLVLREDLPLWGWERRELELRRKRKREADEGAAGRNMEVDEERAVRELGMCFDKCQWEDEGKTRLAVVVGRSGMPLTFEVRRRTTVEGIVYDVECIGDMKELESISRSIYKRESRQDIFETLNMLLAYGKEDLRQADCIKCGQYRDRHGLLPSARRLQMKPNPGGQKNEEEAVWVALHEGCL